MTKSGMACGISLLIVALASAGEAPVPRKPGGHLIAPPDVSASSKTPDVDPGRLIDGSGLVEQTRGGGDFVHTSDKFADGGTMWTLGYDEGTRGTVTFDLGEAREVLGLHVWNYNEKGWTFRGVKDFELLTAGEAGEFKPQGRFALREAKGADDEGEEVTLKVPVQARRLRLHILGNFGGRDVAGLSEVRVRVAGEAHAAPVLTFPKYPRPSHPKAKRGGPPGAEDVVFPADAGVIDVTRAPYLAKGDGKADDTDSIRRALAEHKGIIYLPNGTYLVSDTLRWGLENGWPASFTTLQGQSREGTVIVLKDRCPGFDNPRRPRGVLWTGEGTSADRFGNNIQNLTVDAGVNNPGACGIQYISNNMGTLADVAIVSGDGQGVAGLDMAYTNLVGPLLVKDLKVVGFDLGVKTGGVVNSQTFEHLTLENQNVCGLSNGGQPLAVRGLVSTNAVPAVENKAGFLVLLDSRLTGEGAASTRPALLNRTTLLVRNLRTSGYKRAIDDRAGDKVGVAGSEVVEYASGRPKGLFPSPPRTLGLEVKETPRLPWGDVSKWVSPLRFEADAGAMANDATGAIQAAIDSGAETVYLPSGHYKINGTVLVRGKVRRIIGCRANVDVPARVAPAFKVVDAAGAPDVVVIERIDGGYTPTPIFDNASARTLVLQSCINTPCAFTGTGDVFIEDLCSNPQAGLRMGKQRVWARQLNVENEGTHALNDGGTLWVLGLKTERGGTLVETRGGRTEILGGFSYTTTAGKLAPMFLVRDSAASFAFGETCFNGDPFAVLVRETRGGVVKEWGHERGGLDPIFVAAPE